MGGVWLCPIALLSPSHPLFKAFRAFLVGVNECVLKVSGAGFLAAGPLVIPLRVLQVLRSDWLRPLSFVGSGGSLVCVIASEAIGVV